MTISYVPTYSISDYQRWSDDWELINGHPYSLLPAPGMRHNKVLVAVVATVNSALKDSV